MAPANEPTSNIGHFVWDAATELVRLSDRGAEIYGFAREQAERGIPLAVLAERVHFDDRDSLLQAVRAQEGGVFKRQYRYQRLSGSVVLLRLSGYCFLDDEGRPERHVGIVSVVEEGAGPDRLERAIDLLLEAHPLLEDRPFLQYLVGMALTESGFDLAKR